MTAPSSDERRLAVATSLHARAIDRHTALVSRRFSEEGLAHLLLKGPTTARWLYPDAVRGYRDTDLLVDPASFAAASAVLMDLGYSDASAGFRRSERDPHAETFLLVRGGDVHAVDLHHRVALTELAPQEAWALWWASRKDFALGELTVHQLGTAERCVVLALHLAQSGQSASQPLEDLRRALRREGQAVWQAAEALADRLQARHAFRLACALALGAGLGSLEKDPAWAAASPAVRAQVLRSGPGGLVLTEAAGTSGSRRLRFVAGQLFPSRAKLERLHPGHRGRRTALLLLVHLAYLLRHAVSALRTAVLASRRT